MMPIELSWMNTATMTTPLFTNLREFSMYLTKTRFSARNYSGRLLLLAKVQLTWTTQRVIYSQKHPRPSLSRQQSSRSLFHTWETTRNKIKMFTFHSWHHNNRPFNNSKNARDDLWSLPNSWLHKLINKFFDINKKHAGNQL